MPAPDIASHSSPTADPKKLILETPGVAGKVFMDADHKTFPDSTFKPIESDNFEKNAIDAIREQYEKHGTLTEVVISGHGSPGRMYASLQNTDKSNVNIPLFLIDLNDLQDSLKKEAKARGENPDQVQLTQRIVLDGCDTISALGNDQTTIALVRSAAKNLNADIVGTTTTAWAEKRGIEARWITFSKNGDISADSKLHNASDATLAHNFESHKDISEIQHNRNTEKWIGRAADIDKSILLYNQKDIDIKIEDLAYLQSSPAFQKTREAIQINSEIKQLNTLLGEGHVLSPKEATRAGQLEWDIESKMADYLKSHTVKSAAEDANQQESIGYSQRELVGGHLASPSPLPTPSVASNTARGKIR